MEVTLDRKLEMLLRTITDLVKTTDIISINASISASRMPTSEGRAFKEIAFQIRDISSESLTSLNDLQDVFAEVKKLTQIINLAGKQRMLAQKTLKLHLLILLEVDDDKGTTRELIETKDEFEDALKKLKACKMNTSDIAKELTKIETTWENFIQSLNKQNLHTANHLNALVVQDMNKIVTMYQELAG